MKKTQKTEVDRINKSSLIRAAFRHLGLEATNNEVFDFILRETGVHVSDSLVSGVRCRMRQDTPKKPAKPAPKITFGDWRKFTGKAPRGTLAVTRTFTESMLFDTLGILSSEEIVRRINAGEAYYEDEDTELPGIAEIWTDVDGTRVKVAVWAERIDSWEGDTEASDPE